MRSVPLGCGWDGRTASRHLHVGVRWGCDVCVRVRVSARFVVPLVVPFVVPCGRFLRCMRMVVHDFCSFFVDLLD